MLCDCMKINTIGESTTALTILVPTREVHKTKIFYTLGHCHFSLEALKIMVFGSLHFKVMNNLSKENPLRDISM